MTEDELTGLTMGDNVYVRAEVFYVDKSGRECRVSIHDESGYPNIFYVKAEDVYSAQAPVEDVACRLFRKGDKVQPRSGKTVLACEYGFVTFHELAGQYEVNEDEARGTVTLIVNGHACFVSAFALELVTPVEEMKPYYVEEQDSCYVVGKLQEAPEMEYVAGFSKNRHPNAKAAAEAECDRLNAE